jgi:hypothetical protein
LHRENVLGKICGGRHADLIAVPFSGADVFEQIIAFAGQPWRMAAAEVT